jgi:hypothetical protein
MNAAPHFSLPPCGGLGRKADQAGRGVGTMKLPPFVGALLRAALLIPSRTCAGFDREADQGWGEGHREGSAPHRCPAVVGQRVPVAGSGVPGTGAADSCTGLIPRNAESGLGPGAASPWPCPVPRSRSPAARKAISRWMALSPRDGEFVPGLRASAAPEAVSSSPAPDAAAGDAFSPPDRNPTGSGPSGRGPIGSGPSVADCCIGS